MAIAELNNVTVTKVFRGGKGVSVTGTILVDEDREVDKKFKLWFEDGHELREGDTIGATGFLSAEHREFENADGETIHFAEVSLNNARVKTAEGDYLKPIVSLQDVVVTRFFGVGGVGVEERFESNGKKQSRRFNLWCGVDQDVDEGDVISATGELGTKVRSYTDKEGLVHYQVDINLNDAVIEGSAGTWDADSDAINDEDAPF